MKGGCKIEGRYKMGVKTRWKVNTGQKFDKRKRVEKRWQVGL